MTTLIKIDNFTLKIALAIQNELASLPIESYKLIDFQILEVDKEYCTIQFNSAYISQMLSFTYTAGIQRAINAHTVRKVNPTFDSVLNKIKAL